MHATSIDRLLKLVLSSHVGFIHELGRDRVSEAWADLHRKLIQRVRHRHRVESFLVPTGASRSDREKEDREISEMVFSNRINLRRFERVWPSPEQVIELRGSVLTHESDFVVLGSRLIHRPERLDTVFFIAAPVPEAAKAMAERLARFVNSP